MFYDADTFSWDSFGVLSWSKKGVGLDYLQFPSLSWYSTQFLPYTHTLFARERRVFGPTEKLGTEFVSC